MNNTNHNKPPVMGIASGLDPVSGEHGGRIFLHWITRAS